MMMTGLLLAWVQKLAVQHFTHFTLKFIGGSLESPEWLLDGFLPQNFGRWWGPTNHCFAQK